MNATSGAADSGGIENIKGTGDAGGIGDAGATRGPGATGDPGGVTGVSTHVLDTGAGRPAAGVPVELAVRTGGGAWRVLGTSVTDADGRCRDLPAVPADLGTGGTGGTGGTADPGAPGDPSDPDDASDADGADGADGAGDPDGTGGSAGPGAADVRLTFAVGAWRAGRGEDGFFPEVVVVFTPRPGEHHHVPLLLSNYGYSVYRGS